MGMITLLLSIALAEDVTHKLDCSKIGLYDKKTGRCYLGPNDKIITEFLELERELKEAARTQWLWNHGKSKKDIGWPSRP